jgi:hypothetical protein
MDKEKLHPAIYDHAPMEIGNDSYRGGYFLIEDITFEIDWCPKEKSWVVRSMDDIDDATAKKLVGTLYDKFEDGFSDELELRFEEISGDFGNIFFDNSGDQWTVSSIKGVCFRQNGEAKEFRPDELVYV